MRRHAVGVVFQFFNLLESMTAAENVAVAAMLGGATRRAAGRRARELLDLLGLADKVDALPPRLSAASASGWRSPGRWRTRRRCCWPTSRRAPSTPTAAPTCCELFRRLNDAGQTIVMVTHDRAIAAAAQRTVAMRDGRMVDDDATPIGARTA